MEISTNFLFEHELEIRLAIALLSIVGGFALVKIYTFIAEAREAVLEKYREVAEAGAKDVKTGATIARRYALGNN